MIGCPGGGFGVVHSVATLEIYLSGVESRSNPREVDLAVQGLWITRTRTNRPGFEPLPSRRRAQRGAPVAAPAPCDAIRRRPCQACGGRGGCASLGESMRWQG